MIIKLKIFLYGLKRTSVEIMKSFCSVVEDYEIWPVDNICGVSLISKILPLIGSFEILFSEEQNFEFLNGCT